ncbi:hypothetical protein VB145_02015 [Xanthomonas arboricola]|uniref:Transposase n=1 Tax=Xanthomonas campestris pv. juglandis TaxID=195709 RepID=A0A7U7HJK6_XANCJ|nr:hypothetical protein [Xanthomonas arboricola]MEA5147221.1 hypothetical protein [Xanthomonas arboricola]UQP97463.1 hypothetical protein KP728_18255 [Xanthomonas arboricola pv. juglandis]UQQ01418.1 hypothetical protein KP727_16590 [Xanthomonas arboricola pv. juglandis]CAD1788860.1 hypothetical protein XSP_001055 [Xanthomonas arboricola pv. juglandis]CAD7351400.1 hypothetical protein X12_003326 [Xanthomonas arboricola]
MKKSRPSGADCLRAQAGRVGDGVGKICHKMEIAETTFQVWRKKYGGGLGPSGLKRLPLLEQDTPELASG